MYPHLGHGAELAYMFHLSDVNFTPEEEELADYVSSAWGNFVKYGDPNGPPTPLPRGRGNSARGYEARASNVSALFWYNIIMFLR